MRAALMRRSDSFFYFLFIFGVVSIIIFNELSAISSELRDIMEKSESLRQHHLKKMSDFVLKEIELRQNPKDCNTASFYVGDISKQGCGFGCTLHTVVNLLIQSFMANKTLILRSSEWHYAREGWEYAFQQLGKCNDNNWQSLESAIMLQRNEVPMWLNWAIPHEMHDDLSRIHGQTYVWWIGQFVSYAMRLKPWLTNRLQQRAKAIGFSKNLVGIQVRRGDKVHLKAASEYSIDEYMMFVENWFRQLEYRRKQVKRVVFVASDDRSIVKELSQRYPAYKFIENRDSTSERADEERYSQESLQNVVSDIYFLSRCQYLVCTLTSNVCRAAYELMMNHNADPSIRFQSIDSQYRFKMMFHHPWVADMAHHSESGDEEEFQKGDVLSIALQPRLPGTDGFLRTKNKTRGIPVKIFPSFKAHEAVLSYTQPAFYKPWLNISKCV